MVVLVGQALLLSAWVTCKVCMSLICMFVNNKVDLPMQTNVCLDYVVSRHNVISDCPCIYMNSTNYLPYTIIPMAAFSPHVSPTTDYKVNLTSVNVSIFYRRSYTNPASC